jgi:hypothetical protein
MSMNTVAQPAVRELEYARTVRRELVHRCSLSELFLTDSRRIDDGRFVAAAQLPTSHAYYTDHLGFGVDPLLLLECCRQAETHAVHVHFGAPTDTKFALQEWSLRLYDPVPVGEAELVIAASTYDAVWRAGALRKLTYRMELSLGEREIGEVTMIVGYLSGDVYAAMRRRHRAGSLPSSDDYRGAPPDRLVSAPRVGRRSPDNVLLVDADSTATVRVAGGHPSFFDHAQDHLPGMVLMEAGRQASLLALGAYVPITGMAMSFSAYAELDRPITVSTRPRAGAAEVTFEQDGAVIAAGEFRSQS